MSRVIHYYTIKDFDLFANPTRFVYTNNFVAVSYSCLQLCSYVHYFALLFDKKNRPSLLLIDSFIDIKKYLDNKYIVYAFNHCDGLILPVIID